MTYTPRYTNQALKDIKKLPTNLKRKVEKTIKLLIDDPFSGKPLMGTLALIILVLMVGPRQDIYKRLLRFLES
jgi:mRNA-degrading endonuclease RelE of RelBE toxin-antitoxin system